MNIHRYDECSSVWWIFIAAMNCFHKVLDFSPLLCPRFLHPICFNHQSAPSSCSGPIFRIVDSHYSFLFKKRKKIIKIDLFHPDEQQIETNNVEGSEDFANFPQWNSIILDVHGIPIRGEPKPYQSLSHSVCTITGPYMTSPYSDPRQPIPGLDTADLSAVPVYHPGGYRCVRPGAGDLYQGDLVRTGAYYS